MRFECFPDISDRWTVWDAVKDAPAEFGASALIGLSENEALSLASSMNRLCDGDADGAYSSLQEPGNGYDRQRFSLTR